MGAFSAHLKVREFLAEKRANLIEQVKLPSQSSRKICEKVNAEFKQINKQLAVKTTDPEGVQAQLSSSRVFPSSSLSSTRFWMRRIYFDALEKMSRSLRTTWEAQGDACLGP